MVYVLVPLLLKRKVGVLFGVLRDPRSDAPSLKLKQLDIITLQNRPSKFISMYEIIIIIRKRNILKFTPE
jgi:hypothetical protein